MTDNQQAALRHLVDRAARGVLRPDEGLLLRQYVEHLLGDHDQLAARVATLEHVAASNKRHIQMVVPELEKAEATLTRVRAVAEGDREIPDYVERDKLRAALDSE